MKVLITGVTGMIGAEVASRLLNSGHSVIGLLHREPGVVRADNSVVPSTPWCVDRAPLGCVETVKGDVTAPALGIAAETYRHLSETTDLVVHTAALTEFGRPNKLYTDININGTANVVDFVRSPISREIPLLHVSTAYVCGERTGVIKETELDHGQTFGNSYEKSKCEAEILVSEKCKNAVIIRPSIVVGRERTGVTRDFKHIFPVLKVMTKGRLMTIPGEYGALLDLVPVDYVADIVAAVATNHAQVAGSVFHAIGGSAISFRGLSDVLAEYPPFYMPRFVPKANFDRSSLERTEARYYDNVISLYTTYFNRRVVFDDSNVRRQLPSQRIAPRGEILLRLLLDYSLAVGYLGPDSPDIAPRQSATSHPEVVG
ncbi:SDR family oxidoreductase [Rhodococcus sp. P1Y]|uniref:SDR family oxidoreductase n=1 Tax=Rhodococcus sp. P1Y TaxID=1302308 RepID=UPI000EADF62C|nr:SDR family oxidoreductase [Rhodococcus sp. P1Y]AYJ47358.1 NAD-dependent epimerase/dehydratase family protein [Rhodococcus sp. P1Y]